MAGGLTVSVRQIASYPALTPTTLTANDLVLLQQGNLGGPYATATVGTLIAAGLQAGPAMGIGMAAPAAASGNQLFASNLVLPQDGARFWNAYTTATGPEYSYLFSGTAGAEGFNDALGFVWEIAPSGQAGTTLTSWQIYMQLNQAGNLSLPLGTLSVARDPNSALEVATMGWVGASTVGSFNGRRGVVTLDANDIACALGMPVECLATIPQVNQIVCQAIQDLIHTYPAVWSFNGRVGDVWLTVADINWALAQSNIPPIGPNPPPASDDGSLATTEWVRETIAAVLAGPPAYATQDWVNQQIALINAGVTSFNGRSGAVTLQYLDVASLGFVQQNSPSLAGIPTAPTANPGTSSGQIATTAFVMAAVTAATTGVISWQGRTGAVEMVLADITNVGGAPLANPSFTGTPAAPTAPQGTSSSQIATTAFVMNELAASVAGVATFNGRSGNVTLLTADITAAGGAPAANPALTGVPTAPTAANGTNTQQLATTAFVQNTINAIDAGVTSFNGRSGAVSLTANDITAAGGLANPSPALIGTGSTFPTSQTPAPGDNSTNIATTAFVTAALQNIGGAYLPLVGGVNMTGPYNLSGNATTSLQPVPLQQLNAAVLGLAPLASPSFTGTPTAPTAAAATSTTQLATTAFVHAALTAGLAGYLPLSGGTLTGNLNISSANLNISGAPGSIQVGVIGGTANWISTLGGLYVATLPGTTPPLTMQGGNGATIIPVATGGVQLAAHQGTAGAAPSSSWGYAFGSAGLANFYNGSAAPSGFTNGLWAPNAFVGDNNVLTASAARVTFVNNSGRCAQIASWATSGGALMVAVSQPISLIDFAYYTGSLGLIGSISTNGSSVFYNTTSDDRLKTNAQPLAETSVGPIIDALQPISFNWLTDSGGAAPSYGFSAQATQAVFRAAVSQGRGNPGDEDFQPWGMDYSKLVPLLVAEVQSLRARVAALEAK